MSTDHLRVRRAVVSDAAMIADLSREAFRYTFAPNNTAENMRKFMARQFSREQLIGEVGQHGNIFLLAEENQSVVGYAFLKDGKRHAALTIESQIEVARFYAMPEFIGRGVGAFLMKHCLSMAKDLGRQVIWLGVWEKNTRAIEFYKRFGFEKFGEHEFILGDDHQTDWLMARPL